MKFSNLLFASIIHVVAISGVQANSNQSDSNATSSSSISSSNGNFNPWTSDIRLKQDIQPLENSLDKASRLNGYRYSWRLDSIQGHLAGQTEYGVIAQEVQAEFPQLVKQDQQGYLRVDYRGLVPVLLESIKELKARVEVLEAQR
ncbi:tail fiber domain-containing protein [Spartinivicinus poritis]|uniref:Tail fiber domain-containing protein n=1 Tax=Spartinivicinus poritis TaxID=2994640 RepID=A0ABT5UCS0_9GAMM|nr:tail fiber domain-containing protein [Spartinivicinus sp. A2-2]MDE1463243.1 tail fiber domain-containing protein [Spartinivicinus sp. A2-2]